LWAFNGRPCRLNALGTHPGQRKAASRGMRYRRLRPFVSALERQVRSLDRPIPRTRPGGDPTEIPASVTGYNLDTARGGDRKRTAQSFHTLHDAIGSMLGRPTLVFGCSAMDCEP
jgi:hypothetical protein